MNASMKRVNSERRIELDPRIGGYVYVATTTAKTTAQRVAESDARKKAAGLKKIGSLWAYPDDHPLIRAKAAKLTAATARRKAKEAKP